MVHDCIEGQGNPSKLEVKTYKNRRWVIINEINIVYTYSNLARCLDLFILITGTNKKTE